MAKEVTPNSDAALDKEFEQMQEAAGDTLGDAPEVVEEKPAEEVETPAADAPVVEAPVVEVDEDEAIEDEPVVETPAAPAAAAPAATPAPVVAPKEPRVERPERYIPVPKYQNEKKQWGEEKSTLLSAVAAAKGFEPGSEQETKALDALMAKHGVTADAAKEMLELARTTLFPKELQEGLSKILTESSKEAETAQLAAKEKEEQDFFDGEYSPFENEHIVTAYPNATDEQKQKAKEFIDQTAHTAKYAKLDLAEVAALPAVKKQLDAIMGTAPAAPAAAPVVEVPARKGPEASKPGGAAADMVKATDFRKDPKTKQYDFSRLHAMADGADKEKVVSDLSPEAYFDYANELGSMDTDLEVRRGGKTVILK